MRKRFIFSLVLFLTAQFVHSQDFVSSNLPIVIINTDHAAEIVDSPKILASMKIIDNGLGKRNYLADENSTTNFNYNGRIGIELRGSTSQMVPKKQYALTTLKADNVTNNNVSLLGMPSENDWVLNGMAFEPSLIRDYLSYNLARQMGQYASRTVYCELVLNGNYNGLYVLQEKIKAGSDRVNVTKIGIGDNADEAITGGYITKADKTTGGDPIAWSTVNYLNQFVDYIHVLPKPVNVTYQQDLYIKGVFDQLESTSLASNTSLSSGFPSVIDIPSFLDFMLVNEFAANVDAYQYSTYFHKDRNGKLRAGPIWDFNLTYGNDLFFWGYDRSKTDTWQFTNGDNVGSKFWANLFQNTTFRCYLSKRWNELTQANMPFNENSVNAFIDQTRDQIREAAVREDAKWNTIGDLDIQIQKVKSFVQSRIAWMNANLGSYASCASPSLPALVISKIMYNPRVDLEFTSSDDQEFIAIHNNSNQTVDLTGVYFSGTGFVYQFPANSQIKANADIYLASKLSTFKLRYGFDAFGQFTRNLSSKGEDLQLLDGWGNKIDEVKYSNMAPWPNADGNGSHIELTNYNLDHNKGENWIAKSELITAIDPSVSSRHLSIFPNPVDKLLHIHTDGRVSFILIYDAKGILLQSIQTSAASIDADFSSYSSGFYFVKMKSENDVSTFKLVKE